MPEFEKKGRLWSMENKSNQQRIDKILSHHGYGTRKDVKKLLRSGVVTVNGQICVSPEAHIQPELDTLCIDGVKVEIRANIYLVMNKCVDTVCSAKDGIHRTVFELLQEDYNKASDGGNLHLVGRLDIDTEGLLLLTTDGELTHRLTSPKTHISKTYIAGLEKSVNPVQKEEYIRRFFEGIHIDSEGQEEACDCQSAGLSWLSNKELSVMQGRFPEITDFAKLVIYEGKYHQVKRMFSALGNKVAYLKRIAMGELQLDESIASGSYRALYPEELSLLK